MKLVSLLSVEPVATCAYPEPGCSSYTAITVQMPFEMQANCPGTFIGNLIPIVHVLFSENGTVVSSIDANPVCDRIHLLRTCDMLLPAPRNLAGCRLVSNQCCHSNATRKSAGM